MAIPMKISHYIPSIDRTSGGVGGYMQLLSKELGKIVELHVATQRSENMLKLENCTVHFLPSWKHIFKMKHKPQEAPLNIIKALDQELVADIEVIKFIGNGPLYGELEYEIKEYSLQKKVKLLGTKQQSQVPDYLSNSDILILPSVYDGWGAVVNEALQQGCYVLVSDASGASLLPQMEPKLGKIFNHKDAKKMYEVLY